MLSCIAVVDASRARLFSFSADAGASENEPQLREVEDLASPARRQRSGQLFSESGTTGIRTTTGHASARVDHREAHLADIDTKFAHAIMARFCAVIDEAGATTAMIVASPNMLGLLRPLTAPLTTRGIEITDLALDLTRETPSQLHDHLTSRGLLPARRRQHGEAV